MLPEKCSRDFPFVYDNLRSLFEGWKSVLQKRESDPNDLLLGGDIELRLAGYFNVPEEIEEYLFEPFWTCDIVSLKSEDIKLSPHSNADSVINLMKKNTERFLTSAEAIRKLCPRLGKSVYLNTDIKVRFQYAEVNPKAADGISDTVIDSGLHPHWQISQDEALTLEVVNQMLHRGQGWILEEMRALEKIEEALLRDDLGDDVEWYETSVCYRFQAGLRRSLDVHLDHLKKEINQEDFNTIPEYVPGAWARQRHSWMFHDLYDHHGLSLAEICKIVSWSFTLVRGYSFSTIIHP